MADKAAKPSNPMKYPYTLTAKMVQFPWKFYFTKQWIWKSYIFGVLVSIPVFMKISSMANSPENVAKWAEIRRKQATEHH